VKIAIPDKLSMNYTLIGNNNFHLYMIIK